MIHTVEEHEALIFHVERERGWFERVLAGAMVLFLLWQSYAFHSLLWLFFVVVALAGVVTDWLHGSATHLTVCGSQLVARGNVGRMFTDEIIISAADVVSLGYESGGEDDPSGFYVKRKWQSTCLVSRISEDEANCIADLIFRKFPHIGTGDRNSGSLLFGNGSEMIMLGLSRRE